MTYNYLFPTPVHWSVENDLVQQVLPLAEEYLEKWGEHFLTGNQNHTSTYRSVDAQKEMHEDIRFKDFYDRIVNVALQYCRDTGMASNLDALTKNFYKNYTFLINKINKTGTHAPHSHPNSFISGCYYLKCNEGSPPLRFHDPRPYGKVMLYDIDKNRKEYSPFDGIVDVPIQDGLLLVWPSWLEHEVPPATHDEDRITIAFNLGEIGPYANL